MLKAISIALITVATLYLVANNSFDSERATGIKKLLMVNTEASTDYNYYKYAVEWPGSTCYTRTCKYDQEGPTSWNQHGLWPNKWTTYNIPDCSHEPWNVKAFSSSQLDEIKSFWEGMYSKNEKFWQHEWSKHGTCWNPNLGDLNKMPANMKDTIQNARNAYKKDDKMITYYFHSVYGVHQNIDFYKALSENGITPSNDKSRPLSDYVDAFAKYWNIKNFDLVCIKGDKEKGTLLNEVRICVDMDYNVMDCPDKGFIRCQNTEEVWYPLHKQ